MTTKNRAYDAGVLARVQSVWGRHKLIIFTGPRKWLYFNNAYKEH